jgi:hypothetical protein
MSPRSTFVWVSCVLAALTAAYHPTYLAAAEPASGMETGIVLDHLTGKELRQWRSIEDLVNTSAPNRAARYPTLRGLWQWAIQSGNAIYIELSSPDCAARAAAGKFLIERVDPQAARHIGVIRLCLVNIDRSRPDVGGTRANGFVRFAGLRKNERYAEVLGHELAHAAYDFASPERARMVHERVDNVSAQFVAHRGARKRAS